MHVYANLTSSPVILFGRIAPLRPDLNKAALPVEEGGNGNAQQFWEWNGQQTKAYLY